MYDIGLLTSETIQCYVIVRAQLLYMAGQGHWSSCALNTWYEHCSRAWACVGVSGRLLLTLLALNVSLTPAQICNLA